MTTNTKQKPEMVEKLKEAYRKAEQEQFRRNEELVKREVYCCLSPIVEFILNPANETANDKPFEWGDVENQYNNYCRCGEDEAHPTHEEEQNGTTRTEGAEYDHTYEPEMQEVYEWWAVSAWLFEELRKRGEPVIDTFPHLWGRTTTGQAIACDGVISEIQREHKYAQGDEE